MQVFKKYFFKLFILVFISLNLSSCKKDDTIIIDATTAKSLTDIAYGSDALQKMDIFLPANRTDTGTRVLILIHGGAWIGGDKADFNDYITSLKALMPNYAIFNINYRLAIIPSTNIWPTQINDVQSAYDFILAKANEYKINPNKIALMGASAGAHLAMLQAYKSNAGNRIKAVVDLFGPTDMADLYNNPSNPAYPSLLNLFMSGTPVTNASAYTSASPLFAVTTTSPPTIIFHGTVDATVPISQSNRLNIALGNAGVAKQYVIYTGEGHGWSGANLTDTFNKLTAFLTQYVR